MSVKKDVATIEAHLEPINHEASAIKFDPTGTSSSADNVQDALVDALTASGSGDVSGPSSSTDKAIARFNGVTGKLIENSKTVLQDGGAIEAQGFITRRNVTDNVSVKSDESWITPNIELEPTGSIEVEADGEIIVV